MSAATASSSDSHEPDRAAEPHCARCGGRFERARSLRSGSAHRICVDCAFDDVPQAGRSPRAGVARAWLRLMCGGRAPLRSLARSD